MTAPIRTNGNSRPVRLDALSLPNEEWREAPHTQGYWVSNLGRVFGKGGTILKPQTNRYGYHAFKVIVHGKPVHRHSHRLVCEAFNGPCPEGKSVVAHLDGDQTNNVPSNLAWATVAENNRHAVFHGTTAKGEKNATAKLNDELVKLVWLSTESGRPLGAKLGVSRTVIQNIRNQKTWRHVTKDLPPRPTKGFSA